jgi:hypothetical protein
MARESVTIETMSRLSETTMLAIQELQTGVGHAGSGERPFLTVKFVNTDEF